MGNGVASSVGVVEEDFEALEKLALHVSSGRFSQPTMHFYPVETVECISEDGLSVEIDERLEPADERGIQDKLEQK